MENQIEWTTHRRKVSELRQLENNPRKISKAAIEKMKDRIEKRGFHDVIKLDTDNVILSGNIRTEALVSLGFKSVNVLIPSRKLTDEERGAVILESNRHDGEWDQDLLLAFGEDVLLEVGFPSMEIDTIMANEDSQEDDFDVDAAAAAIKKPITKPGDIYWMGEHRLLCGDSTKRDDMELLMAGKRAEMVFTDPPWNVAIGLDSNPKHRQREGLINDNIGENFPEFLAASALSIAEFNTGDVYCVMGCEQWPTIHTALTGVGLHWSSTIIWAKDMFVLGRSKYHRRYEPIWYGWGEKSSYVGDRKQDDLWEIARPKKSPEHPTMKPVELVVRAIKNSSERQGIVLDLFGGGGSTLVAAENTGRTCYMMELDPKYCDVIVARWEELTGEKATKI